MRKCRTCGEEKALELFHSSRGRTWHRCKDCYYAQIQRWHEQHRERSQQIKRAYREKNRLKELEAAKARRLANPVQFREAKNAAQRKRRTEEPGKHRAHLAKRRKQLKAGGDNYTAQDVRRLYDTQNGFCAAPGCATSILSAYHVDHITPLARGGTNSADNIQLLCPPCNYAKSSRDPYEWAQSRGALFCM
jgi:5-methylcytosine-specific restriction endonuclease McrA